MTIPEHVKVRKYGTTVEAKAAERFLIEQGVSREQVSRSGKNLRVDAQLLDHARVLLAGTGVNTDIDGGNGMNDELSNPTTSRMEDAGSTVQDAASGVVDTAQNVVAATADTAQQAAGAVVDKVQDAAGAVTGQVAKVSNAAADKVEQLADKVEQGASSSTTSEGQRKVVQTTANVLDRTAEYLRAGDVSIILEDLRTEVRRHPLRTLALGLGAGYLLRNAFFPASPAQSQSSSRPAQPGGTWSPRQTQAVPVYSEGLTGSATISSGMSPVEDFTVPTTSFDTDTTLLDTQTADSLLYGLDADVSTVGTLAGGSDDTASSYYGESSGVTGDVTSGLGPDRDLTGGTYAGDAGLVATDLDLGTGTYSDTSISSLDMDVGTAGGATTAGMDADLAGDSALGTTTSGGAAGELGDTFGGTGSGASDTTSSGGVVDNDLLKQWDNNTRGTQS